MSGGNPRHGLCGACMNIPPVFPRLALLSLLAFLPVAHAAGGEEAPGGVDETRSSPAENTPPLQENSPPSVKRTLSELLSLLEKAHGVTAFLDQSVSPDQMMPALSENLSPEQSIRILFADYDYFLFYGSDAEKASNHVRMVWVFPRSSGAEMRIVPKESLRRTCGSSATEPAGVPQQEDAVVSPHEQMRALNETLSSGDENTWNEALQSAIQSGLPITSQQLEDSIRNATSDHVRAEILSSVKLMPNLDPSEVQRLSDIAAQDSSPIARDVALELQKSLTSQESLQIPDPPLQPSETPPPQ